MATPTPSEPRIHPIDRAAASDEQAAVLDAMGGMADLHLFRTLAHNPGLLKAWLRFGGHLLQRSGLPERDRERVILRVAGRCGSEYEWGQHVGIARAAGLSDDEIRNLDPSVEHDEGWSTWDTTLVRAADELLDEHCLSDATWSAAGERYDDAQLLELTMLVGHYAMLAGMLRSAGVQTESPLPAIGEV